MSVTASYVIRSHMQAMGLYNMPDLFRGWIA